MISLAEFEPVELGLPEKFTQFRPAQLEAVEQILNNDKRFQALALPTGSGKTLIAMAAAKATGLRTAILTSTLGLMRQYEKDFLDLVAIRGKANYECQGSKQPTSCRFGHLDGCHLKKSCTYEIRRMIAKQEPVVLTNYSYWLRANRFTPGLQLTPAEANSLDMHVNPFGLLILDEGHEAMEELSRGLQVDLRQGWLKMLGIPYKATDNIEYWSFFASTYLDQIDTNYKQAVLEYRLKPTKKNRDLAKEWGMFLEVMTELKGVDSEHWVCEMRQGMMGFGRQWSFAPIWPAIWAESRLFQNIPKVVLMSATLRPAALRMLGIPKEDSIFREWPRVFPAQYTPIYHIKNTDPERGPVSVRIDSKADAERLDKWVAMIDAIISARLDRKGLIHTVSYARQEYLLKHSKHAALMMANTQDPDSPNAVEIVELFKASDPPSVLVSPSFSTGWDFPGSACEYQIIAKVPFPDTRNKLMRARLERSQVYGNYLTMQDLVQACGRGTRSETDRCELFIADSHIEWFFNRNRTLAPRWFEIMRVSDIPPAPPKVAA